MKILHVTPSYKPASIYGGTTVSISRLCEELAAAKQNPEVITTLANGIKELALPAKKPLTIDSVNVHYFKRITKDHTHFSPALLWYLHKNIRRKGQYQVIHIHSWWNFVSTLSCIIAKVNKIPVILSPRGMLSNYTLNNRNKIFKLIIHQTIGRRLIAYCHIHATSKREEQDILKIYRPKSITIIPNFGSFISYKPRVKNTINHSYYFKTPSLNTAEAYPIRPFKLLFLSRIEEKKGLDILFKSLSKCDFHWKLTIAGTGKLKYINDLKALAIQLKISKRLNWIGQANELQKQRIFKTHDLLTLFSHNENFANVILESLHAALPVAISKQVGLSDYVVKNDLGWVSELSIPAITSTLNKAYVNAEKRIRIQETAPKLVRKDFSNISLLKQYLKFYNEINEKY